MQCAGLRALLTNEPPALAKKAAAIANERSYLWEKSVTSACAAIKARDCVINGASQSGRYVIIKNLIIAISTGQPQQSVFPDTTALHNLCNCLRKICKKLKYRFLVLAVQLSHLFQHVGQLLFVDAACI